LPAERLSKSQRTFAELLLAGSEAIADATRLANLFALVLRDRSVDARDRWLVAADASMTSELRGCASSLRRDLAAVPAAVTLTWSNGQTEGQVNKIKLFKREMFGRANVDLLRARLLYAA
jgi:transposase